MTGNQLEQPDGRDRAIADRRRFAHQATQVGSQHTVLLIGDKGVRDEKRAPAGDKGKDRQCGQTGPDDGQDNLPPGTKVAAPIDECRPLHVPGHIVEKALHQPDAQRQLESQLDQDHAAQSVVAKAADDREVIAQNRNPGDPTQNKIDGDQQRHRREGVKDQRHSQEFLAARETEP